MSTPITPTPTSSGRSPLELQPYDNTFGYSGAQDPRSLNRTSDHSDGPEYIEQFEASASDDEL